VEGCRFRQRSLCLLIDNLIESRSAATGLSVLGFAGQFGVQEVSWITYPLECKYFVFIVWLFACAKIKNKLQFRNLVVILIRAGTVAELPMCEDRPRFYGASADGASAALLLWQVLVPGP
jgi:hypothetical protein